MSTSRKSGTRQSSTSKKHRDFVSEPMGKKPVTALAGVGPVLGERLKNSGYGEAHKMMGQYLILDKNETAFKKWMKDTCNATSKQSSDCYESLNEWSKEFM